LAADLYDRVRRHDGDRQRLLGLTADFAGIPWTFAASAFCLFAFDCAATRWRIPGDEVPTVTIGEPVGQSR
jgi:hypothetical protein